MEPYSSSSSSSSSRTKSNGRVFPNYFKRSISPSGRFCSSSISSSNSMSSSCQSSSGWFLTRPTSPSRVNLRGSVSPPSSSSSIRFSTSPSRSIALSNHKQKKNNNNNNKEWSSIRRQKKTCTCSPTTHPGSFRCSLHKNGAGSQRRHQHETVSYHSHRLDAQRSAMTNSLVRIGTVEGDLVRRALAALIRPSSHQQKRRADFQPRPTRFSIMSKAQDV